MSVKTMLKKRQMKIDFFGGELIKKISLKNKCTVFQLHHVLVFANLSWFLSGQVQKIWPVIPRLVIL